MNGIYVLKSGTDFREFSEVTLDFRENGDIDVTINKVEVNSSIPEDPAVKDVVQKFESKYINRVHTQYGIPRKWNFLFDFKVMNSMKFRVAVWKIMDFVGFVEDFFGRC